MGRFFLNLNLRFFLHLMLAPVVEVGKNVETDEQCFILFFEWHGKKGIFSQEFKMDRLSFHSLVLLT